MNLRKDHYRWSEQPRQACFGERTPLARPARAQGLFNPTGGERARVPGREGSAPAPSGAVKRPSRLGLGGAARLPAARLWVSLSAGAGPAGEGPGGTKTLRPRRPAVAARRVPNSPPSSGGSAGGSMSPASASAGGLGAPAGFLFASVYYFPNDGLNAPADASKRLKSTTLSGGSLGSCVDEERS